MMIAAAANLSSEMTLIFDLQAIGFQTGEISSSSILKLIFWSATGLGVWLLHKVGVFELNLKRKYVIWGSIWFIFVVASAGLKIYKEWREYNLLTTSEVKQATGIVKEFQPKPYGGEERERFTVSGVKFAFNDEIRTYAFHHSKAHGGPVNAGSKVKIGYVSLLEGKKGEKVNINKIIKLEMECGGCTTEDYSKAGPFTIFTGWLDAPSDEVKALNPVNANIRRVEDRYLFIWILLGVTFVGALLQHWIFKGLDTSWMNRSFFFVQKVEHHPFSMPEELSTTLKNDHSGLFKHTRETLTMRLGEGPTLWARFYGFGMLSAKGLAIKMDLSLDRSQVRSTSLQLSKLFLLQQFVSLLLAIGVIFLVRGQFANSETEQTIFWSFFTIVLAFLIHLKYRRTKKGLAEAWQEVFAPPEGAMIETSKQQIPKR